MFPHVCVLLLLLPLPLIMLLLLMRLLPLSRLSARSACRAVWYCGTACSHADWRAGHRRVCKALAAERQATKAARAAAAAGQQPETA